jgi:conjugal transfer pilus assembly protein TraI
VGDLLAEHAELLRRIRLNYGLGSDAFEADLKPLIARYAGYVHALPATADNYFAYPGGLLTLGLETAFFSLQGTDEQIFCGRCTISQRRQLEPRWRLAAFIGGLCHSLHRAVTDVVVTDVQGESWPAFLVPLEAWLTLGRADRYWVHWPLDAVHLRSVALFALPHIVATATLGELSRGNNVVVPHLLASIGGLALPREPNVLDALVHRCAALVIGEDMRRQSRRLGRLLLGSHWAGHVVDAMQRLVRSNPAWVPNTDKSRLWWGPEGLFMVWPQAAKDIVKVLEQDQLDGIPRDPATLLQLLSGADVIEPHSPTAALWQIRPPGADAALDAVRFGSFTTLLHADGATPAPLTSALVVPERTATAAAEIATPAASTTHRELSQFPAEEGEPALQAPLPFDNFCDPSGSPAAVPSIAVASPQTAQLRPPKGLNPQVREALSAIVATLNGTAPRAARLCSSGVFIPLEQLEKQGLVAGMVVRALTQARMLVPGAGARKTILQEVDGQPLPGVVLDMSFVEGVDPTAFATARRRR